MSTDLDRYLDHLYGDRRFYIQVCTLNPKADAWDEGKPVAYMPSDRAVIERMIRRLSDSGLNVYVSAHGYIDNRRGGVKANAAPIDVLWVERDEATIPPDVPEPTMTVETSPGRYHDYWRLSRTIAAEVAEDLNRRLTYHIGGDSGWALTKRLRPPETINHQPDRRPGIHQVRLLEVDDARVLDPDELEQILPKLPPAPTFQYDASSAASSDDEPPVVLSPAALAAWRNERPVLKPNGEIDQSDTLYKIGAVLHEHGATRPTIVRALADRDMSLGFRKYVDRPIEYQRIAEKVAPKPRLVGPNSSASGQPQQATAGGHENVDEDACSVELAKKTAEPVSYTHLTLPTICSV